MCDEITAQENEIYFARQPGLTRREFNTLAAGATLAMMLPRVAGAVEVKGRDVNITTPDGQSDCYFVAPASGQHPGILIWPDIMGLRPAFRAMGDRLAQSGYAVLVVNPFYRGAKAPVIAPGESFQDEAVRNRVMPLARALTPDTQVTDAKAYIAFLDAQAEVDKARKVGTTGYCMGGPFVMRTAATVPNRVGAGATFHGGGLATDRPDSPHLLIPKMTAHFLICIAENDDQREPDAKGMLREAFDKQALPAEIEVYQGTMHGWCPPDSRVYNEAQAERAWGRMLALFKEALA